MLPADNCAAGRCCQARGSRPGGHDSRIVAWKKGLDGHLPALPYIAGFERPGS